MVNLLISVVSGALLSAAFAPFSIWWLAPIGLALHMYSISRSTRPFLQSFLFALVFNAITLHWTSIYVGSLPWIILFVGQAVLFAPLGLAKKYGISFYPFIFLIVEEVRSRFPFGGFGWLRIAFSQADAPYRNIAAFGGVSALTAMVLTLALALFALMHKKLIFIALLPLLLLLISVPIHHAGSLKVLMVQGDVPELGLDFNSRATAVFFNHIKETKKALAENNDVDLILWPENAVDVDPFTNNAVSAALNDIDKPLILGAVIRTQGELQNASIHWTKDIQSVYVKQHLTPFGEYIPLRTIASKISPFVDDVEDFSPGKTSVIFSEKRASIAPVICFELIDDQILSQAAKAAQVIVVQTNSATFGRTSESAQQLAISRIRAIEHGKNILSVSTTGISATINYLGVVDQQTAMHTPAHIVVNAELLDSHTPRDKAGDWALVLTLVWLVILARRRLTN